MNFGGFFRCFCCKISPWKTECNRIWTYVISRYSDFALILKLFPELIEKLFLLNLIVKKIGTNVIKNKIRQHSTFNQFNPINLIKQTKRRKRIKLIKSTKLIKTFKQNTFYKLKTEGIFLNSILFRFRSFWIIFNICFLFLIIF